MSSDRAHTFSNRYRLLTAGVLAAVTVLACIPHSVHAADCAPLHGEKIYFPDPNSTYVNFMRAASALKSAPAAADGRADRAALAVSADNFRRFSREIDVSSQGGLLSALDNLDRVLCNPAAAPGTLRQAVDGVIAAVPQKWMRLSARLRGRDQPGHPLRVGE